MNYELARFRNRLAAYFIDQLVIGLMIAATIYALIAILELKSDMTAIIYTLLMALASLIVYSFLYEVILIKITKGKTLGKAIFNIRIVKLDSSKLGTKDLIKRWILKTTFINISESIYLIINCFVMKISPYKQTLHDKFSKTIFIKSPTPFNKKALSAILAITVISFSLLVLVLSSIAVYLNSDSYKEKMQERIQEHDSPRVETKPGVAQSLTGEQGPWATLPDDEGFITGFIEYNRAADYYQSEKPDLDKAKESIDKAYEKNKNSINISTLRCYIYSDLADAQNAYDICSTILKRTPNNPEILYSHMYNLYLLDRCAEVGEIGVQISNMQFDDSFEKSTLSTIYGSAGIYLAYCEVNQELSIKFLEEAKSLTNDTDYKNYYQEYIDSHNSAE